MADDRNLHWGWRIFWGVVGAGLTATVLVATDVGLAPAIIAGISVAGGIVVALVGPMVLELLALVS